MASGESRGKDGDPAESLERQAEHVLGEARMVLPGVQALFGFQLIAVFSDRFAQLPAPCQIVHLTALAAVAVAVALIMTPAAYHRQTSPTRVTAGFVRSSSVLLTATMVPLMLGIALDLYVVGVAVLGSHAAGIALALVTLAVYLGLWFVYPRVARRFPAVHGKADRANVRRLRGTRAAPRG